MTKPKRRHPLRFIVAAAIVVLLIAGVVVADNAARGIVAGKIETQVRSSLAVPASTPVDVSVGGASVLLQLIFGSLDRVDVGVNKVSLGALSGSAQLTANGIPLDSSRPTSRVRFAFVTDQAALESLFSTIPGLSPEQITIADGNLTLSTKVALAGFSLPVGIEFSPSAKAGQLQLTPTAIVINKVSFTAEQLKASAFGGLAEPLFVSHSICIASQLPKGFTLESVQITGTSVQLTVVAKKVILSSALLSSRGTCPSVK